MESGVQNKIFITILSILSLSTFSEEFKVKKTWFGDPDLQGVWTNASLTTLERPDHFDALEISDEVADYAKKASQEAAYSLRIKPEKCTQGKCFWILFYFFLKKF